MSNNIFGDREKAFEAQFSLDNELQFKIVSRRDKMLGLWAAGEMGLTGPDAEAYARSVVQEELSSTHDVLHKVKNDLAARDISISDARLSAEMERFYVIARKQIMTEYTPPE